MMILARYEYYRPSTVEEAVSMLKKENTIIAVQKIFGLENKGKTLGDVKLASSPKPDNTKEMARPIANTVNKMFNDL